MKLHFPTRLALSGMLLAAGGCGPGPDGDAAAVVTSPSDSAPGPSLVVETFDGGRFDLADHRGQWVVVNYWATWCAPCLKEIPDFSAFAAGRNDVTVVGLAYEEIEPEAMRAFLEKVPAGYPIAIVDVYDPPADFDPPRALPTTYLVAPDGQLARTFMGPVTSEQLAEAIAGHDAG